MIMRASPTPTSGPSSRCAPPAGLPTSRCSTTGKSDRGLRHILATHGLSARFVTLQTADRHPSKPHPSMIEAALAEAGAAPEASVMIGDTSYDMAMARAAGTRAVGVVWGYHARDDLTAAGAHAIAETAAQLAQCMEAA